MNLPVVVKTEVLFDTPIVSTILPPDVDLNQANSNPTYQEITEIVAACKEAGFAISSIVVRRSLYKWGCVNSAKWGCVSNVKQYRGTGDYFPLTVRWLDSKEPDSQEWPSALYLINRAEDAQDIFERIKLQDD